ncbi:hypothetical protein [Sphingopyxis lindanitolerans]|uniref:hypothetical protein n=1 Tax=Sphingopyxis lindanitolerans TaxID=2054227 RepID=UPI0018656098|nr:hypothetical protein [Sphingopyxis lindanitolerans]
MIVATAFLLAACSGGDDKQAAPEPDAPSTAEPVRPAEEAGAVDLAYTPDPAVEPPAAPDPGIGTGDKAIPAAIQGHWALNPADCRATPGADLTAFRIDAKTLRFFESAGDLARVRERSPDRLVADYKFSGEGEEWDRLMQLTVEDGGKTLVRRDYGEGAAPEPMRYSRCA